MKRLALAAIASALLGGCATMDNGNGAATRSASAPAAGAQYCWQDRLSTGDGKHTCNWAGSAREACEATQYSAVEASRYTAPRKARLCANGQWLVEVARAPGA